MTRAEHLVLRVRAAGFHLELSEDNPVLVPDKAGSRLPRGLLADLRAERSAIIRLLKERPELQGVECHVCGRHVTDDDRPHLVGPGLCDRGGSPAVYNRKTKELLHPATPRCPFKPPD